MAVEFDREHFRKRFPNLAAEMETGVAKISINSVRTDRSTGEKHATLRGFLPDVIDFLRRCETHDQALEIIAYLEKRCEISGEYANKLRDQLSEKGLKSFGERKKHGYYFYKYYNCGKGV